MVTTNARDLPTLARLVSAVPGARLLRGDPSTRIGGVSHDSRLLRAGELFVAVPGFRRNGLDFVDDVCARGAGAIVAEVEPPTSADVPLILVPSARIALAELAAAFHDHPSRKLSVVGVTGTDGKTTTIHLLSAILEARGLTTGWLSTINTKIGDEIRPNGSDHTTPEAPLVQGSLAEMAARDVDVALLEASSHALALERIREVHFSVGVLTNLSPEHLNFHGSFAAYREAKGRLFADLPPNGLAVLNADDPSSRFIRGITRAPVITFALEGPADVRAMDIVEAEAETRFVLRVGGRQVTTGRRGTESVAVRTNLVGRFNVANWLAAYCAATHFGATPDDLRRAAERQDPVLGRMNFVHQGQPFLVLIDFAHTPHALARVLATARRLARGRVLLMFGLPGGRDSRNRPAMGWLAATGSDFVVITTDDPYDEDPRGIAEEIVRGAELAGASVGEHVMVDLDRRSAVRTLLRRATAGDVVVLAGHGHLDTLVIGREKLPWNDATAVVEELRELGYRGAQRSGASRSAPTR